MKKSSKAVFGVSLAFACWVTISGIIEAIFNLISPEAVSKCPEMLRKVFSYVFLTNRADYYLGNMTKVSGIFLIAVAIIGFFLLKEYSMKFRIIYSVIPIAVVLCLAFSFWPTTNMIIFLLPLACLLFIIWIGFIIYKMVKS